MHYILLSQRKDRYMSESRSYRTKDEWLSLIQECRKSGMSDIQWCQLNGINHDSFYSAVKRLRKSSYSIPPRKPNGMYDITVPEQDVVPSRLCRDSFMSKSFLPLKERSMKSMAFHLMP